MYARANIEEGKSWDLRKSIMGLAGEICSMKNSNSSLLRKSKKLQDKEFLKSYIREMSSISAGITRDLKEIGSKALMIWNKYSLTEDMFYQKGKGIPGFIGSDCRRRDENFPISMSVQYPATNPDGHREDV